MKTKLTIIRRLGKKQQARGYTNDPKQIYPGEKIPVGYCLADWTDREQHNAAKRMSRKS